MARMKTLPVPEVGAEAPEFHLPSVQGGQLRLSIRTATGPVVIVFYSGSWSAEDVAYFKDLATREDEINLAGASIVGIGKTEPAEAHDFVRETGIKSYVLYDYAGVATREYGLLERDKEHGEYARPATFLVGPDRRVIHAWLEERPSAEEILAKVSEIIDLLKPAEEEGEGEKESKKAEAASEAGATETGERKKLSPEEREKRRAERRAAREKREKPAGAEPGKKAGVDAEPEDGDAPEPGSTTESKPAEGE